jgi:hypothetical protein
MPKKSGKTGASDTWYGWALLVDSEAIRQLSAQELNTLEWAEQLAESRREWGSLPPHKREREWPLTVDEIAEESKWPDEVTRTTVSRRLAQLRRKLFGQIGRRAIYARAARRAELRQRSWRPCAVPGCQNLIPPDARTDKDTCSARHRKAKQRHT